MRIVLDTNVLISGIFFIGPPNKILHAWKERKLQVVFSPDIYFEYVRVAEIIQSSPLPDLVCEDPDNDKFIACALSGNVDFIVSGDKKLLQVSGYEGMKILKPSIFCEKYLD